MADVTNTRRWANMYLKDSGHGITEESLKFWHENKNRIGIVTHVEVSFEPLFRERANDGDYDLEYNMMIFGHDGCIMLSGCTCGYGGTGPNGTAKILAELGLPIEVARKAMLHKTIHYDAFLNTLALSEG